MTNKEYLLAEMRVARLRAQVVIGDLDAIGMRLNEGVITPEQAMIELQSVDLVRLIGPSGGRWTSWENPVTAETTLPNKLSNKSEATSKASTSRGNTAVDVTRQNFSTRSDTVLIK